MIVVDWLVCLAMVATAIAAMASRNLLSSAVLVGVVSLFVSYLFLRMAAPDVAMTEAAIGAGLGTVIVLIAVRRTREVEE